MVLAAVLLVAGLAAAIADTVGMAALAFDAQVPARAIRASFDPTRRAEEW